MFKNINIETLDNNLCLIEIKKDSYIKSYQYFVDYFKGIEEIQIEHVVLSSHFVYGWMPTIIRFNWEYLDRFVEDLNKVKNGIELTVSQLDNGKKVINNSLVGLSKLLHFVNPEIYAIWDSRIYRFLTGNKSSYGISNIDKYLKYLSLLNKFKSEDGFNQLHKELNEKIGYEVTALRALELIMFESDKQNIK